MRRRDFVTGIAGATAAWPLAARAQQADRVRRVGILLNFDEGDPVPQARIAAFLQELARLGWTVGRNLHIDARFGGGDAEKIRRYVAELVSLGPDAILTAGGTSLGPLIQATRTVPIVFASSVDPVGAGFVESLARPGGNVTGFATFDFSLSGKWIELLKRIAPGTTRAVVLRDSTVSAGPGQFAVIQAAASAFGIEVSAGNMRDAGEIERAVAAVARTPNAAMIVTASAPAIRHIDLLLALAARHRLPATYPQREFVARSGLVSYGPDNIDLYRRAAGYVERILKGEKPADLPVQAPTKFELVVNLKTAKALGLDVPDALLAAADHVIE